MNRVDARKTPCGHFESKREIIPSWSGFALPSSLPIGTGTNIYSFPRALLFVYPCSKSRVAAFFPNRPDPPESVHRYSSAFELFYIVNFRQTHAGRIALAANNGGVIPGRDCVEQG